MAPPLPSLLLLPRPPFVVAYGADSVFVVGVEAILRALNLQQHLPSFLALGADIPPRLLFFSDSELAAFIPSLTLEDGKKLLLIALQLPRLPRLALSAAGSVSRVLEILHLSQYTDWFTAQDVDLGVLRGVTELDLDDVEPPLKLGHKRHLLAAIAGLAAADAF